MNHLNKINKNYFQHLKLAIFSSAKLIFTSCILLMHGIFPFLWENTASNILKNVIKSFPKDEGDRILIRFNTKWKDDPLLRQWRILINNKEILAKQITIKTSSITIEENVGGEQKFHFLCHGKVLWNEYNAEIV